MDTYAWIPLFKLNVSDWACATGRHKAILPHMYNSTHDCISSSFRAGNHFLCIKLKSIDHIHAIICIHPLITYITLALKDW